MAWTKEQVLAKISALLEMTTGRGCSEAEAQSAAAKVANLLTAYNIDAAEVQVKSGVRQAEPVTHDKTPYRTFHKGSWSWQLTLAGAVERACFCRVITYKPILHGWNKRAGSILWIGTDTNIMAAAALFNFLLDQFGPLATLARAQAMKDARKTGGGGIGYGWVASFYTGLAYRVAERLRDSVKVEQSTPSAAPVALALYNANDAYALTQWGKTRPLRHGNTINNSDAYGAGRAAGDRVNTGGMAKQLGGRQ